MTKLDIDVFAADLENKGFTLESCNRDHVAGTYKTKYGTIRAEAFADSGNAYLSKPNGTSKAYFNETNAKVSSYINRCLNYWK